MTNSQLDNLDPVLRRASGYAFYNTSPYDIDRLLGDAPNLAANLHSYINGFSPNMRDVLDKFDVDNTIAKLDDAGLLFKVLERFKKVDLHPSKVSNLEMGYIFEELIRRFNEALNENPGEHFTPREVIRLMVNLLLLRDKDTLSRPGITQTVYDPCCGSGGMLTSAKERILELNRGAQVYLFGQEVNPETYAVAKSDLYLTGDGRDADNIAFGSVLSTDRHAGRRFNYLLANPPYGKDWKMDKEAVEAEAARGAAGRFAAGLPRISDGQLLFLEHMLAHMYPPEEGGSRVAVIMNGSPLFSGDAGQGESEIRRHILENDWLEAIVALPEQLFYNTGIVTYIAVLTNHKEEGRRGKAQLVDATGVWTPMRKSLGEKRRQIPDEGIERISHAYFSFTEADGGDGDIPVKIFDTRHFGYRKVAVERPLRLNVQASPARIARLREQKAFQDLAVSKKRDPTERAAEEQAGRARQEAILAVLADLPGDVYMDRALFERALDAAARGAELKTPAPVRKAILAALSACDENAEICRDDKGGAEADPELRDWESVPLGEDVDAYIAREVTPYAPDAWVNQAIRDEKDGEVGKVGYEINFNRYFYRYSPPRPLAEIERDIKAVEGEILAMLRDVTAEASA